MSTGAFTKLWLESIWSTWRPYIIASGKGWGKPFYGYSQKKKEKRREKKRISTLDLEKKKASSLYTSQQFYITYPWLKYFFPRLRKTGDSVCVLLLADWTPRNLCHKVESFWSFEFEFENSRETLGRDGFILYFFVHFSFFLFFFPFLPPKATH